MAKKPEFERESVPRRAELPTDREQIARLEARNALHQFDSVLDLVDSALRSGSAFKLRPSTVLELNRLAITGVNNYPGVYRPHAMEISQSQHVPPPAQQVPQLMEEMCEYVNSHWDQPTAHLASYLLWRINWIHPFDDGNGRTARAVSYAALCIRVGYRLPGESTIPAQIATDKRPYYEALEAADRAYADGKIDVSKLEEMIGTMLAKQFLEVHTAAMGGSS